MGLFFRKAFRLGPLRLNLSKRGLGASVGVKGARVGVDSRGQGYAAGGRGGVYFRERLGRGLGWWWLVVIVAGVGLALWFWK